MDQPITLLIIGPTPPPFHGVAVAVQTLLTSRLNDLFAVTHLEIADRRGIAYVNSPDLHDVRLFIGQWVRLLWRLMTTRPQIVYLVLSQSSVGFLRDSFFMWPAWLFGARLVVHLHGGAFRDWYNDRWFPMRAYVRATLRLVRKAIVLGDSLRNAFAGLVPEERIAVVPNGVECEDEWIDREFPDGKRPWRLLYLNTLNRMKGALVLLASIPTILRTRRDVEFVFAGPWSHEEHRAGALQYIARHKLESFVRFTGQVTGEAKRELLRSSDAFLFPGIQPEGQPLVVLEAMAAGLPTIFTNQGCLRDTVLSGEGGIEAYANDPYDLALRILELLDRPDECRRLGYEAQRRCRLFYSKDRYVERMISVFQDVASDPAITHSSPILRGQQR